MKIYSVNRSRPLTAKRLEQFEKHEESFVPITRPTGFLTQSKEDYEEHWKHTGEFSLQLQRLKLVDENLLIFTDPRDVDD